MPNIEYPLSVSSIQDIINAQTNMLNGFRKSINDQNSEYCVSGTLCNRAKWYESKGVYYKVMLKDIHDSNRSISLMISEQLINDYSLRGCEYITVTGFLCVVYYKNTFAPRFKVTNIMLHKHVEPELIEANEEFSSFFKTLAPQITRQQFPIYQNINIAVVTPLSGSAFDDFNHQLSANIVNDLEIKRFMTNICDKNSIIETINNIKSYGNYNVLIIIRGGGGEDTNLNVFDELEICETVASFDGYKIIGLGHTEDNFLLDLVVDYSTQTPTAVGSYLNTLLTNANEYKNSFITRAKLEAEQQHLALKSINTKLSDKIKQLYIAFGSCIIILVGIIFFLNKSDNQTTSDANNEASAPQKAELVASKPLSKSKKSEKH